MRVKTRKNQPSAQSGTQNISPCSFANRYFESGVISTAVTPSLYALNRILIGDPSHRSQMTSIESSPLSAVTIHFLSAEIVTAVMGLMWPGRGGM